MNERAPVSFPIKERVTYTYELRLILIMENTHQEKTQWKE